MPLLSTLQRTRMYCSPSWLCTLANQSRSHPEPCVLALSASATLYSHSCVPMAYSMWPGVIQAPSESGGGALPMFQLPTKIESWSGCCNHMRMSDGHSRAATRHKSDSSTYERCRSVTSIEERLVEALASALVGERVAVQQLALRPIPQHLELAVTLSRLVCCVTLRSRQLAFDELLLAA